MGYASETLQFKRIMRRWPVVNVFLKKTATNIAIQVFGLVRDFGELRRRAKRGKIEAKTATGKPCPTASFRLKPDGYSATKGSATGAELGQYFAVVGVGLEVQKISGVEHCFSAQGQSKAGQLLCYLNAQRRIVNGQPAGKRIDGEHCCIWRETKDSSNVRSRVESSPNLQCRALKESTLKQFRWLRRVV